MEEEEEEEENDDDNDDDAEDYNCHSVKKDSQSDTTDGKWSLETDGR